MASTDLAALERRARRGYELGRVRQALLGVAPLLFIVPLAACLTHRPGATVALGAGAFALGAILLWYGRDPQKAGWMYALYPASVDATKPAGEWNRMVSKCAKTSAGTYKCEHLMNGTKYVEYEIGSADWNEKVAKSKFVKMPGFGKAAAGHLCLQDHGNEVAFRNIKIRALP